MKTPTKGDDYDLVDIDTYQDTNNEESEVTYQREESKKYNLESDQ